ncbi:2Fe-2S iron-sulfur cluster binding domain-containing protein [Pseudidiomarina gelatinasegens]|jgi:Na+-transporting NADH:ubiquinone oxidoreductase subunit F|uniref:2Fe-2S iron-sulfur cluster binding domain-containing protein n=1 Tax=Pseudidiomarina gelatinasegens TaxID=2487740 RepID=A0A443YYR5_9GAMM|nr:2Fe-2S iron-sulfur cluster-binding protein [Pseudidiomarina gelatinasegens]RWU09209.1 2Fe-2S iron-sulfur cluster binding domain-containing protein [Pseudidiomarina gelatinasegens]
MMRFMQWLHRWLGLVLLIQVILWLVSGFYFALQGHHAMSGHQYKTNPTGLVLRQHPPQIDLREMWDMYPQALSIKLYRIGQQPQYQINLPEQQLFLDGNTGEPWFTNAKQAEQLALATYDGPGELEQVSTITTTEEIFGWQGKGYRVDFRDDLNTRVYVDANNGRVLDHRNTPWLLADWAFKLHFMDYSGGRNFNHLLNYTAAFLALWFTLSGLLLLIRNIRRGDLNPRRKLSILEALQRKHQPIASGCGGGGTCGLCKVMVDANTPITDAEQRLLSTAELTDGIRLACQHRDHGQAVQLLESNAKRFTLKLAQQRSVSPLITELKFTVQGHFSYQAGQFMQFEIPSDSGSVLRNYSFACAPATKNSDTTELVFLIRAMPAPSSNVPAGIGSSYLCQLQQGDPVHATGPFGDFLATDRAVSNRPQIYIAGGVGIAPIRALVQAESAQGRPMHLFHGARSTAELIYCDEFVAMSHLRYVPVISDQTDQDIEQIQLGNIDVAVAQWLQNHPGDYDFYVCGPPAMLQATLAMLASLNVDSARIRFDDFGI